MKTIIMIDHGGVLDQDTRSTLETIAQRRQEYLELRRYTPKQINEMTSHLTGKERRQLQREYSELRLYTPEQVAEMISHLKEKDTDFRVITENEASDPGVFSVMPDAPETFRLLNELVDKYDCELVFHSSNSAEAQLAVKNSLEAAMHRYNRKHPRNPLTMPRFTTMAILDSTSSHAPNAPEITDEGGMVGLRFHSTDADGKTDLRTAIAAYYKIPEDGHTQHFVIDDGGPNIRAAERENYTAVRITPARSTLQALNEIRTILQQRREQTSEACEEVTSHVQADEPTAQAEEHAAQHTTALLAGSFETSTNDSLNERLLQDELSDQTRPIASNAGDLSRSTAQETVIVYRRITHGYDKHRQKHNLLTYDMNANSSIFENQVRQKFASLRGDELKKNILDALAKKLSTCENQALPDVIQNIRNSYEYHVLQQRQNPWWFGQFFKRHTDSINELECMISQAEKTARITPTRG